MGFLTVAGAISGAGKAGQQAFSDMSRFAAADMMETRRQEMDLQKQERLLEAQRGMHRETIEATSREKGLDRKSTEYVATSGMQSHETIAQGQNETTIAVHKADRESTERVHQDDRLSHEAIAKLNADTSKSIAAGHDANTKDIAKINTDATKSIHYADRLMKKYEIETTADNSTKMATSRALTEIGNETTRLTALLANPMLDPATAKELQGRLGKLERIHDAYSRSMLPEGEKGAAASTPKKNLPPFKFPQNFSAPPPKSGGGYPGSFRTPGVKVLPMPGEQEQEMMGRALQP